MICPECRAEYPDGIVACRDCREVLVSAAELERGSEYVEYACVASTFNVGDVGLIRSVFDVEGIVYHLQGEYFNLAGPLADPVLVLVAVEDVERAQDLLSQFDLTFGSVATLNREDGPRET